MVSAGDVRARVDQLLAEHADDDETTFLGAQFDAGLARMDYPVGLGGLDAEPALQEIVDEALEAAGRRYPWIRNAMGIGMCGPTLVARGTRDQQERFLRPIFTAEEIWCQLFSEPGAGSDVAGLSTSAVRDGDQWIVNGSKIWTSQAHKARYGLLLARTDPDAPKHKGLTAFVVDMHEPGVEVRGIRSMAGASGFNEVFFTDSVVPDSMRVGDVGEGWRVGTATLMNERVSIGSEVAPQGSGPIARAVEAWHDAGTKSPAQRDRLMQLWVDAEVLRLGSLRAQAKREKGVPGPEGSILKLLQGRVLVDVAELVVDLMGPAGTLLVARYTHEQIDERETGNNDPALSLCGAQAATIAGGTTQIQMNIIGERVLGLPREPGIDPNTPWNQIPRN
ncbi:MAG TPA: acyl-CoA dehydrogenase family protein [Acidimicrobiia bacterium]|jgi:alkylation response protein AidB-like acyl-CoA dehydrogenase